MQESREKIESRQRNGHDGANSDKGWRGRREGYCAGCASWEQKTQDLMWGYEELLSAKEKELETISKMVAKLDEDNSKLQSKADSLAKKLKASEAQLDKLKSSGSEMESLVNYYKEREVDLLSQLKTTENELFTKTVQVRDDAEARQQTAIEELVSDSLKQKKVAHALKKAEAAPLLLPALADSESLGRIIQKNLCEL